MIFKKIDSMEDVGVICHYLFYTDYGRQWDRVALHRMFVLTKKRARIDRPSVVHVFGRQTPATLMIAHGVSGGANHSWTHQHTHNARYTQVNYTTKRTMYDKFITTQPDFQV